MLLTGTNGLGKSNFFDAIEWGLTGKVRRFDRYLLKKKIVESDYLTRRGAAPNSHRVTLGFTEGDDITRSTVKAPAQSDVIRRLAQPNWGPISDIGTYLAFTHFLGQAAQQRFTSREPEEQWESLKGPSGIERLEEIRNGLRGRATQLAFTKRIDAEAAVMLNLERRIAEWQGWRSRLTRLRQASQASGQLSAEELAKETAAFATDVSAISGSPVILPAGATTSQRLKLVADHTVRARRTLQSRRSVIDGVAALPEQWVRFTADAREDGASLVRARQALESARSALASGSQQETGARDAVEAQAKLVAEIEADVALLEAVRHDIERSHELERLIEVANAEETDLASRIATLHAAIAQADRSIARHADIVSRVAQLQANADAARQALERSPSLVDFNAAVSRSAGAHAAASEVAARGEEERPGLVEMRADLLAQRDHALAVIEEKRRRAGEIAAAVIRIANHLHDDDTICPVCRTVFEQGELKLLAEAAMSGRESGLAADEAEINRLDEELASVERRITVLDADLTSVADAQQELERNRRRLADAQTALAASLGVSANANLAATALQRDESARAALVEAEAQLEAVSADVAGAGAGRAALLAEAQELESHRDQTADRRRNMEEERRSCSERMTARSQTNVEVGSIGVALATRQSHLAQAQERDRILVTQLHQATTAAAGLRAQLNVAEHDLGQAVAQREAAEQSAAAIRVLWTVADFTPPPRQSEVEAARTRIAQGIGQLDEAMARQQGLGKENEATLLRQEIAAVETAMRTAGGEGGITDPGAYQDRLNEQLEAARDAHKLTARMRTALNKFTRRLKEEAESYSTQILAPLNDVIDAFNEAMLSAPGESIRFSADHRVDATRFDMTLHFRDRIEDATFDKELPPQIVLSEGQLAANGFSILCAASTAYAWSRWRALLLDDPLQHNDIIHTAAFVDVMRNMVELQGYQLIMSSHDRAESDFIARKFDAADFLCVK